MSKIVNIFYIFFLLSITYVLPGVIFAKCFTCAADSPISSTFLNLPLSTTTTAIEILVNGNCSITHFLFGISKYPFSISDLLKYLSAP